eukprot:87034_1
MSVSHFLTNNELAKHTRNIDGFVSAITPAVYIHKLYVKVKQDMDQLFRKHFEIDDPKFHVTFAMDPNADGSSSTAALLSSSDRHNLGIDASREEQTVGNETKTRAPNVETLMTNHVQMASSGGDKADVGEAKHDVEMETSGSGKSNAMETSRSGKSNASNVHI